MRIVDTRLLRCTPETREAITRLEIELSCIHPKNVPSANLDKAVDRVIRRLIEADRLAGQHYGNYVTREPEICLP